MGKNDPGTKIRKGFQLLDQRLAYSQIEIVRKLKHLNYDVSRASFNNVIRDKRVGGKTYRQILQGMEELLRLELGVEWDDQTGEYGKPLGSGWTPVTIEAPEAGTGGNAADIIFHADGRVAVAHKVAFMEQAQTEIIELGLRLNTFTESFTSLKSNEFMMPIRRLLNRGVNMKLYLIDPESNEALMYFNDRAKQQEEEAQGVDSIKKVLKKLSKIKAELYDQPYPGSIEVYLYKNVPYNNFLIIDPESIEGRMMVSHYLYGIRRADCPVVEFSKKSNRSLYRRYLASFTAMINNAKKYSL